VSRIGVYAGSFDPFTNGHLDVLKQVSELFDKVYLVMASNSNKSRRYDLYKIGNAIIKTLDDNNISNVEVLGTAKLIADFAKEFGATYLIRGLRNTNDYNYEENIAKVNKELNNDLNTIYFRANSDFISSSIVCELIKYGKDVSKYVPKSVLEVIQNDQC
jgi:pantetheine-phosphate adenylyltransferase